MKQSLLALMLLLGLIIGSPSCTSSYSGMGLGSAKPPVPTPNLNDNEYLNVQPLKDVTLVVVSPSGRYGSSVAVAKGTEGKTILLTAAHIFMPHDPGDMIPFPGLPVDVYRYTIESDLVAMGRLLRWDAIVDLALVEVDAILVTCELAERNAAPGQLVVAVGYPMNIIPCIATLGVVFEDLNTGSETRHTAGIFYGNSGGPLFDLYTHRLVGINIHIYPVRDRARSDNAGAVCVDEIRKFLYPEAK